MKEKRKPGIGEKAISPKKQNSDLSERENFIIPVDHEFIFNFSLFFNLFIIKFLLFIFLLIICGYIYNK
jgi:hypothetical protein